MRTTTSSASLQPVRHYKSKYFVVQPYHTVPQQPFAGQQSTPKQNDLTWTSAILGRELSHFWHQM